MEATNEKRKSTTLSGILLVLCGIGLVALIAFIIMTPGVLESLATLAIVIVVAIVLIALVIFFLMAVLAIPLYMYKGEKYQVDKAYGLDEVKSVKETDSDDKDDKN
jgi:membrane protein YdbS with pleckstrin-like domain